MASLKEKIFYTPLFNSRETTTKTNESNEELEEMVRKMRVEGQHLLQLSCKLLTVLMCVVTLYSCLFESFANFSEHVKVTIPLSVLILAQVISQVTARRPNLVATCTLALVWLTLWSAIEREIMKNPNKFQGLPEW
jgi:hypothetical protein